MYHYPTSHRIDPASGGMSGATGRYDKRLGDLAGIYADANAFARALEAQADRVVYRVHETRPAQDRGDLIFGTTWMEPGRIGDEYFMTRGHIHARANRPETYYGESGTGLMLMETPEGETRILEIMPRVLVYVPPMWIHRSVNTGADPLVMSFCYPCDSGQDYQIIENSGGMASRIVADGAGWKAVPNRDYRPRGADEIARVHGTSDGART
ncbi:glucose-6-phosphate isomerase [Paracoccus sp. (in: a-proteobacteria)]|uniref:glucose-6-phosphate isomerase n=1 Tax=Paracoccus sp. TaxID=267 RepID=UPI003A8581A8